MSNSGLVTYTKISPNKSVPRNQPIDKITIHHCAGVLSLYTLGQIFANPNRDASSNYGIDVNGKVGMYCEEKDRAWTSSSGLNDNRAITIEVANSSLGGEWPVSDASYNTLINLCVDICKRNGIKKLNYTGTATGNLTEHRYFKATLCPGPYLHNRMAQIAKSVNEILNPISYKVKVPADFHDIKKDPLNIRSGPGVQYPITGVIDAPGVYTIVETDKKWGKLKSGVGWISLYYAKPFKR